MYKIYLWKANGIPKYVGSTKLTIKKRFQSHYSNKNSAIYKYMQEHPDEEFSYVAIDYANTKEESFEKEEFWTLFYRERYSMLNIFNGSTPDDNTRNLWRKQRKGKLSPMKGKKRSEGFKKKLSEAKKGKHCGKDNSMYGKHHTDESKKKMSENRKGKRCGKVNPNATKVRIKETNMVFDTINECAEFLNVSRITVRHSAQNNRKMKCGFTAEYIDIS